MTDASLTQDPRPITIASDRGHDEWAGIARSILAQMAPESIVIDLTHSIARGDSRGAGLLLARSVQYLAPGVVVVNVGDVGDPDVRLVAIECAGGNVVFLGPDTGVLAAAVAMVGGADRAVSLDEMSLHLDSPGLVDAGRDVLIPVAAHLATGTELTELGTTIDPATLTPGIMPLPTEEDGALVAEVLAVDYRGWVQLNVDPDDLAEWGERLTVSVNNRDRTVVRVEHGGAVSVGQLGLLTDSVGMLAIVASGSSAADELSVGPTDQITLRQGDDAEAGVVSAAVAVSLGTRPERPALPEEGTSS